MPLPEISENIRVFGTKIGEAISAAITQASGNRWQFSVADDIVGGNSVIGKSQCYRIKLEGAMGGDAFLEIADAAIAVLDADATDAKGGGASRSGGHDMLGLLKGCSARLEELLSDQGTVSVSVESVASAGWPESTVFDLLGTCEKVPTGVSLRVYVSKMLEAQLLSYAAKPFAFADVATANTSNLDLVLDVALSVTLRFGQRRLALREVLELESGSVVELDRQVDEPVELVLDGRVVARGEAVIIDGNYGMRITQVVQPVEL